jgi:tetratricopeptide (TPR) repeat protein
VNDTTLYPEYVSRPDEERQILEELAQVREGGSRAVLLYGPGGVGKTQLVRALVRNGRAGDPATRWLDPIDVDDSEYWLLSNLERKTVEQLDPEGRYFQEYLEYLSELPQLERADIGYETVVSHLARIKRVFKRCYTEFVEDTGTVVVVSLDTVEAIRGMDLLITLTQWMKALPRTLFLLSGRPPAGGDDTLDAIAEQFTDPHEQVPALSLRLGAFTMDAALRYLRTSALAQALSEDEQRKFVHLAQGHPLWLAITLDYLQDRGMPEEAGRPLAEIQQELPHPGAMTETGSRLHEAFKRRLVTPYRDTDFWHETTKRLAVVRKNVSRPIWHELMEDRPLPPEVDGWEDAWHHLLSIPWIRPRANRHYVTLHDAFADELSERIIPVHDQNQRWRRGLWERAVEIYGAQTVEHTGDYERKRAELDEVFRARAGDQTGSGTDAAFITDVERLSRDKRELDQLRAAHLYYEVLLDPEAGSREFLNFVDQARRENDVLFQTLVTMEMQRFLPGAERSSAVTEAIGEAVDAFHVWLTREHPAAYVEIGIAIADYHVTNEQWESAVAVLEALPMEHAPALGRYRLHNLLGNAYMRLHGRVRQGLEQFEMARAQADTMGSKLRAEAEKELGFYFRNVGRWEQADAAYSRAHDLIYAGLTSRSAPEDHAEVASIRTNWAYVKGLRGERREGHELVESAIAIRRRFQQRYGEGLAWSVYGELHRFDGEYDEAWKCYRTAEQLFHSVRSWHWLGQIYQQQAVCLHQAAVHGVPVADVPDPSAEAEQRIRLALDICHDQAIRGYPSALNRAGRIFARKDLDDGLRYLREGIDQARELSDGWFLFANLVEFAELNYEAWRRTGAEGYRDEIGRLAGEVERVSVEFNFPNLAGRWSLVRGHVIVSTALDSGDHRNLPAALEFYTSGFQQIAEGYLASHGLTAIPDEFAKFQELLLALPEDVRDSWEIQLRKSWGKSVVLLARLEALY